MQWMEDAVCKKNFDRTLYIDESKRQLNLAMPLMFSFKADYEAKYTAYRQAHCQVAYIDWLIHQVTYKNSPHLVLKLVMETVETSSKARSPPSWAWVTGWRAGKEGRAPAKTHTL